MPDLTTLYKAKSWLGIKSDSTADNALLSSLITQVSAAILGLIERPNLFKKQHTETFTGSGTATKVLRNYPVLSISGLTVGGIAIPAGNGLNLGYWLDPDDGIPPGRMQALNLNGYAFCRSMCSVVYQAGFFVQDEAQIAAATVEVDGPYGSWAVDGGVTYANGTPLTLVEGVPAQGQYALLQAPGTYRFATADAGQSVLISYSYVPAVLEQACLELVGERYRYKDRIGHASKTLGGQETISYSLADMPAYIKTMLQPYRRMVPL